MTGLVLGGMANVFAGVFLVPQIRRILVHRDGSGVSPTWAAFGVSTNVAWAFYLVAEGFWLPAIAPVLALVMYGALVIVLAGLRPRHNWTWCVIHAVVLGSVASLGGRVAFGTLLVITPAIQIAPELIAVYRHKRPAGVSPTTWALGLGEALCWGAYGYLLASPALVGYGLVTSIGSLLILGRWWVTCGRATRGQRPRPSSDTSTKPSLIAVAAASPRLAAVSLRRMFET